MKGRPRRSPSIRESPPAVTMAFVTPAVPKDVDAALDDVPFRDAARD